MAEILRQLGLTFIPLFVAMDSIGNLPILIALTRDMTASQRSGAVRSAMLTALALGLGFVFIGKAIFQFLGIEVADFLVAGGIILLVLSIKDLVTGKMVEITDSTTSEAVGVVPLGTPLVAGPAVLTTLLLLIDQYSIFIVVVSLTINLAITYLLFRQCNRVVGFLGKNGVTAISKIVSLLLAAIAISLIRRGIVAFLG
jgi:multiple antibiotic resistance protein